MFPLRSSDERSARTRILTDKIQPLKPPHHRMAVISRGLRMRYEIWHSGLHYSIIYRDRSRWTPIHNSVNKHPILREYIPESVRNPKGKTTKPRESQSPESNPRHAEAYRLSKQATEVQKSHLPSIHPPSPRHSQ